MLEDVVIDPSRIWHIAIGNDVTLAPRVQILMHDTSTKRHLGRTRIGKVAIGDRAFVGTSTVILPGVTIGSDVIIGPGSIVTEDIPSWVVAAGNPARVLCSLLSDGVRRWLPRLTLEESTAGMNARMKNRFGYIV